MIAALVVAAVLAVADWVLVARTDGGRRDRLRWVTKPGTMIALAVAVAVGGSGGAVERWMFVGLILSLAGDVFLLLPESWFLAGLGAFLLAHLAYVVGMAQLAWQPWRLAIAALVIGGGWVIAGRQIVGGAAAREPAMRLPVLAYVTVISSMVAVAIGVSGSSRAAAWLPVAAIAFYTSDALLGTNRFVGHRRWMPVGVMVTYHAAQAAFVAFLVVR